MGQPFDLKQLADRLTAAADRVAQSPHGLKAEVSGADLILVAQGGAGGHGTGRTESLAFAVLFHDDRDRLAEALDRLERYDEASPPASGA